MCWGGEQRLRQRSGRLAIAALKSSCRRVNFRAATWMIIAATVCRSSAATGRFTTCVAKSSAVCAAGGRSEVQARCGQGCENRK